MFIPVKELTPIISPSSATKIALLFSGGTAVQINPPLSFVRKYPSSPVKPVESARDSRILILPKSTSAVGKVV